MAVRWKGGWSGSGSPGTSLITYYNGDSVLYLNISNNLFSPSEYYNVPNKTQVYYQHIPQHNHT